MRRLTTYAAVLLIAAVLACGSVLAAFRDAVPLIGAKALLPATALVALLCAAAWLNAEVLTPRLLRRGKTAAYAAALFGTVYLAILTTTALEYVFREHFALPHRISDYRSPWILLDALSASALVLFLLAGLALFRLYYDWRRQALDLRRSRRRLERGIRLLRERLNPEFIFSSLDEVISLSRTDADGANARIRRLSDYLRGQLYDPSGSVATESPGSGVPRPSRTVVGFLTGTRFRPLRHIIFQLTLFLIAAGSFFAAPDRPEWTADSLGGVLALYLILNAVAYVNIYLLFPRFRRGGHTRRYFILAGSVALALAIVAIPVQIASYGHSVLLSDLPLWMILLSTLASVLTIVIFLFGTAALAYLRLWLGDTYETAELRARTADCELRYLKKQINPHFLFNVLNNAGIMIYEDPAFAERMLRRFRNLIDYQLGLSLRTHTTLRDEISFLTDYLELEKSRRSAFGFGVLGAPELLDIRVPVLLFIPFVENAVKFCGTADGRIPRVDVSFSRTSSVLCFRCVNTFSPGPPLAGTSGGLGISNTRRRLELIYGSRFSLRTKPTDTDFTLTLTIPS